MGKSNIMCTANKCYSSIRTHPNKSFFGFPSNIELCKIWLENCGRTDINVNKVTNSRGYFRLCEDHFEDKWFTDESKRVLRRKLSPVPTIFLCNINTLLPPGVLPNSTGADNLLESLDSPCVEFDEDRLDLCDGAFDFDETYNQRFPIWNRQLLNPLQFTSETVNQALLNLNPETELYIITEMCRFCMGKAAEKYLEIFSGSEEASDIRIVIDMIMPNKISECDGLPQRLCRECVAALKICQKLFEQFQNADQYLRAIANYSLFIENEDGSEVGNESEEIEFRVVNNEVMKPIPKNAMVMSLETFRRSLEDSYGSSDEVNIDTPSKGIKDISPERASPYCEQVEQVPRIDIEKFNYNGNVTPEVTAASQVESLHLPMKQSKLASEEQNCQPENWNFTSKKKDIMPDKDVVIEKLNNQKGNLNLVMKNQTFPSEDINLKTYERCKTRFPKIFKKAISTDSEKKTILPFLNQLRNVEPLEEGLHENVSSVIMDSEEDATCVSQPQDTKEICWICGIVFVNSETLIDHLRLHDGPTYHCESCGQIVDTSFATEHRKSHGKKRKKYICKLCQKVFWNMLQFNTHMIKVHLKSFPL